VMWPSPPHFFVSLTSCVADFSPPSVFYCFACPLISAANQRLDGTNGFVIVPYSRIHQATEPSLLSIQHRHRLEPFRLHPNTPVFPYR